PACSRAWRCSAVTRRWPGSPRWAGDSRSRGNTRVGPLMASILDNHPNPIPLPRLSLAAIALAVALACLMASVVGIAAWTIHSGSGITQADVAAAQKAAYANGRDA